MSEAGALDALAHGMAAAAAVHLAGVVALGSRRTMVALPLSWLVLVGPVLVAGGRPATIVAVVLAAAAVALRWRGPFTAAGAVAISGIFGLVAVALPWAVLFAVSLPVGPVTRMLLVAPMPFAIAVLPVALVRQYENIETLARRHWRRPSAALGSMPEGSAPRVCIHVPTHAEPPDVVIATLDALSQLRYPNFEVLVIDNNTSDDSLWRPVEAHCDALGERFRFVHVDGLTGANAGALNLALTLTPDDAELIAVIDADYVADPTFLVATVGFFTDPSIGFVQSPHAYRGWEDSWFLRACRWEYDYFFATGMPSLNERDAALTVGTMCVVRRRALAEAGGWAEWCLTEDSELAIRIHAAGYSSVFVRDVLGRGLIPETFAGYRKQRFRWTYGPVQELYHHHRTLRRGPRDPRCRLSLGQRIHHATHGLYGAVVAVSALLLPLGAAIAASMVVNGERVPLPRPVWIAITATLAAGVSQRWAVYRRLGAGPVEFALASLATMSLAWTIVHANVCALLRRPTPWQRTSKFTPTPEGLGVLRTTTVELLIAGASAAIASVLLLARPGGLVSTIAVGLLLQAAAMLAAPVMALVAERDIRRIAAAAVDEGALASTASG